MTKYIISCLYCNAPVNIRNDLMYMTCMCDEDNRIIPTKNIINWKDHCEQYLLKITEGYNYATMENSSSQIRQ